MNGLHLLRESTSPGRRTFASALAIVAGSVALGFSGCASLPTEAQSAARSASTVGPGPQLLSAGDVVKIAFPGAPSLETTQQIRRDGWLNLATIGEVKAAGQTPAELERELTARYSPQLVSKEIKVTVVSSSFAVFVSGAVLKPGKITPERAITALEAIMEAGGFDLAKGNPKAVRVIRYEEGQAKNFTLNLKDALDGKPSVPFYLKSHDVVFVPEKFVFF